MTGWEKKPQSFYMYMLLYMYMYINSEATALIDAHRAPERGHAIYTCIEICHRSYNYTAADRASSHAPRCRAAERG